MPEVNRLTGKHLFSSVVSNTWFAEICFDAYLVLYVCGFGILK